MRLLIPVLALGACSPASAPADENASAASVSPANAPSATSAAEAEAIAIEQNKAVAESNGADPR
jgi:hypothetical protein